MLYSARFSETWKEGQVYEAFLHTGGWPGESAGCCRMISIARASLLKLARSRPAGWALRKVFTHMTFLIPSKRLRETPTLVAFYHPSPSYPVHILLVPRREYRSLLDVPEEDVAFQRDLFSTVQDLVRELELEPRGYRLVVNGGANQDVPVLHFHLIAGERV